ncbi:SGNH/GDSL hydrolase family protein, partial [bacterium]|nr:SGNH/GDSL hydrolase family protein [bacterium]
SGGGRGMLGKVALLGLSALACLSILEGVLQWQGVVAQTTPSEEAADNSFLMTIPAEWARRPVQVKGDVQFAYLWHGKLHVLDRHFMRRTEPFPPRRPGVFRIMLVGDSLTYGLGVSEEETYGRVLEDELNRTHRAEVLNLGVCGYQSEDILGKLIRPYTPKLRPDLVVYGVCLNDFLESGTVAYGNNLAWRVPLPERVKRYMTGRTRTGTLLSETYGRALMALGIRDDFKSDILKDYKSYRTRFARDVKAMNDFVLEQGLPPVVALVLHQHPDKNSALNEIAVVAEEAMEKAGMRIVPCGPYLEKYDGERMNVSAWEVHPNVKAHRIFAETLLPAIRDSPGLEPYRKDRPALPDPGEIASTRDPSGS